MTPDIKRVARRALRKPLAVVDRHWRSLIAAEVRKVVTQEAHDVDLARHRLAAESAARYVQDRMEGCRDFRAKVDLLDHSLTLVRLSGLFLEFGVYRGASINFAASRVNGVVHGFDSFHGLPEDFAPWKLERGSFSTGGAVPDVNPNVMLHQGLFEESLPEFLRTHHEPVAWVHVDCDLYSSTRTVLANLAPRLRPGTVLLFDDYFNYPEWERNGEYRAFKEFVTAHDVRYRYASYMSNGNSVAVVIDGSADQ